MWHWLSLKNSIIFIDSHLINSMVILQKPKIDNLTCVKNVFAFSWTNASWTPAASWLCARVQRWANLAVYRAVEILCGGAIPAVFKQCGGSTEEEAIKTPGQGRNLSCRARHSTEGIWRQEQHGQKHGDERWGEAAVHCGAPPARWRAATCGCGPDPLSCLLVCDGWAESRFYIFNGWKRIISCDTWKLLAI